MLTSGDLESLTGESRRTIQFWADGRVLRPEPGSLNRGAGRPKMYLDNPHHGEAKWALLASRFSAMGLTLAELRDAINAMRMSLEPLPGELVSSLGFTEDWETEKRLWQSAIIGAEVVWLAYGRVYLPPVYDMPSGIPEPRTRPPHHAKLHLSLDPQTLQQWAASFSWKGVTDPSQRMAGFVAFDLTELFAPLHGIYRPAKKILDSLRHLREDPNNPSQVLSLDAFEAALWLARNRSMPVTDRIWALEILSRTKTQEPDSLAKMLGSFLGDPEVSVVAVALRVLGGCSSALVGELLRGHLEDLRPVSIAGQDEMLCDVALDALEQWNSKHLGGFF